MFNLSLSDELKIYKYIGYKGDRYFENDYVELTYSNGEVVKGHLRINDWCVCVAPVEAKTEINPHTHYLDFNISKIIKINKVI